MRDLVNTQESTQLGSQLKHINFKWKIRNGDLTLFWEDSWYEGQPLLEKFQKLYQLSNLKNQVVRNLVDLWSSYDHDGLVFWSKSLRSWELEEVKLLGKIISSINLKAKEDLLIWIPSGKKFSTKDGMDFWRKKNSKID